MKDRLNAEDIQVGQRFENKQTGEVVTVEQLFMTTALVMGRKKHTTVKLSRLVKPWKYRLLGEGEGKVEPVGGEPGAPTTPYPAEQ